MFKECNRILTIWDNDNNEYVNAYEIQDKVMTVKFSLMIGVSASTSLNDAYFYLPISYAYIYPTKVHEIEVKLYNSSFKLEAIGETPIELAKKGIVRLFKRPYTNRNTKSIWAFWIEPLTGQTYLLCGLNKKMFGDWDICEECGELKENIVKVEDDKYCPECLEKAIDNGDILSCDECGEYFYEYNVIWVQEAGELVCEDCAERHFCRCENCGHYVVNPYDTCNGDYVCSSCAGEYSVCEGCGNLLNPDDVYCYHGLSYCSDCYDDCKDALVYDYDYSPNYNYYRYKKETKEMRFFGCEIETTCDSVGNVVSDEEFVYAKYDSSILENGHKAAEFVTHPATLKYWHKGEESAYFLDKLQENASVNNSCGMHIHVSKNSLNTEQIEKAILFISNNYQELVVGFCGRELDQVERYAQDNLKAIDGVKSKVKKAEIDANYSECRYVAVNTQNYNTVEFRIFASTVCSNKILSNIEFVDCLLEYCGSSSYTQVYKSGIKDLYKYAQQYNTKYPYLVEELGGLI